MIPTLIDMIRYRGPARKHADQSRSLHDPKPDKPEPNRRFRTCSALGRTGYFWMICRFIETKLGNHNFRATGITAYLKNGGTLEKAAAMANHASTRTTQLYDRRRDGVSLDEVERIVM